MYSVIILAAGNGSRLKTSAPKVLHKIGGLSLLDHVIRSAKAINPDKVVVVTKPNFALDQLKYAEGIAVAVQKEPKGTGHAVRCGLSVCCDGGGKNTGENDWVFILYADIPLVSSETLHKMTEIAGKSSDTGIVVLAMNSKEAQDLGKLEPAESQGTIKGILEAKDACSYNTNLLPLCNCGLLIKASLLNELIGAIKPSNATGEIYITEVVKIAYERGYTCRYYEGDSDELSGANTLAEMAVLERNFQNMMRERFMANGVTLVSPETVFFSYDTQIEPDVVVHPYVVFGEGVRVKRGAVVGPFCVVEGAEIREAQVGPFSRLRLGSEIHDGAKIGNFVEIKKSTISEKTKVNHLTYVGDSFIGKNTNVGAGTITCNYDGINKHRTDIGENVFIGSNSAIVAPVKIHDNATIGAGSVITKDVPENSLAVARGFQKNIESWSKKK